MQRDRRTYQQEQSGAQECAADLVERAWQVVVERMPTISPYDWTILSESGPIGLGEFKWRRWHISPENEGVMLSLKKATAIAEIAKSRGLQWHFFVWAENGLFSHRMAHGQLNRHYEVKVGGRAVQTRDRWDIEQVILIPCAKFEKIEQPEALEASL